MSEWMAKSRKAIFYLLAAVAALCCAAGASLAQPPGCPLTFKHPGFLSLAELTKVKNHVAQGDQPWKSAFDVMQHSRFASLKYVPHPFPFVSSGFSGVNPVGLYQEQDDSIAAYTQALMWVFTGDERYAKNAAVILDAWSSTLQAHQGLSWYLEASWIGSMMPSGAELLRATYPKWTAQEIAQFKTMLNNVFLPVLHNRPAYGNREMSTFTAMMTIGVFNDDPAAFCEGLSHLQSYVHDYIYLTSDGPQPKIPTFRDTSPSDDALTAMDGGRFPNGVNWIAAAQTITNYGDDITAFRHWTISQWWYNPGGPLVDGLSQETGRDLAHSELAMAGIFDAADIAWHQGIDVYTPNAARLAAFLERSAGFRLGAPAPFGLYANHFNSFNGVYQSYEIGFNHLKHQNGMSLPLTNKLLTTVLRPVTNATLNPVPAGIAGKAVWGPAYIISVWQTLTNTSDG